MGLKNDFMQQEYEKRVNLEDAIPLAVPLHINIDPSNNCNYNCFMCPTDNKISKKLNRPSGVMKIDLFKKIIDNISEMGILKSLALYCDGEPFINKNLIEMITYAKRSQAVKKIVITSNGSLITEEISEKIIETNALDLLIVSIYSPDEEHFKKITKQTKYSFADILKNITYLRKVRDKYRKSLPEIYVKMIEGSIYEDEYKKLMLDFKDIADHIGQDFPDNWDNSDIFLSSIEKKYDVPVDDITFCPKPWYSLNIAFNGDVRICCADWSHSTVIGNVSENNLKEIWTGNRMFAFRKKIIEHNFSEKDICLKCNFFKKKHFGQTIKSDNIDNLIMTNPEKALVMI